ncbi:acylphosphatase [Liquorilactobacillus mali]|nr:acylphosphatase [Liquorilactobacillus mali]MDN7144993.1 acylphosphatase [Liquorilactobacillus mali]
MKSIKITVHGRVQGVGFRYCTKMVADQLNINGIVKNQSDGSVYIEAQGDPQAIHSFAKRIIASPTPSGHVSNYDIADNSIKNYTSFNVVY